MPDYPVGPSHRIRGRGPVLEAYAETGALDVDCIHCGAKAGEFCCHDPEVGGMPRRLPCPKRIVAAARAQSHGELRNPVPAHDSALPPGSGRYSGSQPRKDQLP